MSDLGKYAAIEAEIMAALVSASDIATASGASVSELVAGYAVEDLIYKVDPEGAGSRGTTIGVLDMGAVKESDFTIAQRQIVTLTNWEVAVVVYNMRGHNQARVDMRKLMEVIRDRLHYYNSSIAGAQRYLWMKEQYVDTPSTHILAKVATYQLRTLFGQ